MVKEKRSMERNQGEERSIRERKGAGKQRTILPAQHHNVSVSDKYVFASMQAGTITYTYMTSTHNEVSTH